ncbi:MAG: insulinase family protein [Bdellovibrionales bacterium]|nr:insulinase family protein [Bdellovibrionales bacterium]
MPSVTSSHIGAATRYRAAPGLRVVTERHAGSLSAAVGIFVGYGSRNEPLKWHGATHLAEHLFFKGTSKHSAEEISTLVERHGGEINAFTDRELTAFHAVVPADQTEMALELLFEMIFDSLFDPKEFDREKSVVLQELRSYADNPDEEFGDSLLEIGLAKDSLGRRIAGFPKEVSRLTRKQVIEHIADNFLRSEIVVSVVSPLKEDKVKEIIRRILRKADTWRWGNMLKRRGKRPVVKSPVLPADMSKRSSLRRFRADQMQFSFMFPAVSLRDHREVYWSALANLLGGGSSSKLFREVRERRGLAYSTHAQLYTYSDVGLLSGYLATNPKRWFEAVSVAGEACRSLAAGIAEEDLDFVKSMMVGGILMSYDGINNRMESLARQELLLRRTYTLKQAVREVQDMTKKDIDRVAKALAVTPCFAALGPVSQKDLGKVVKAWNGTL